MILSKIVVQGCNKLVILQSFGCFCVCLSSEHCPSAVLVLERTPYLTAIMSHQSDKAGSSESIHSAGIVFQPGVKIRSIRLPAASPRPYHPSVFNNPSAQLSSVQQLGAVWLLSDTHHMKTGTLMIPVGNTRREVEHNYYLESQRAGDIF